MVSVDISSARLVPALGADGWLCRLAGAVVWSPGSGHDSGELISACLSAGSPRELLGRVGSRLADPEAAPWPPFAIMAARGAELVVVVHGPVEVTVTQDGAESRLYGGDELGSWLNRLLRNASGLRAGKPAGDEGLVDLREGVIRAGGFLLGADAAQRRSSPARAGGQREISVEDVGAESPTAVEQVGPVAEATVGEATVAETGVDETGVDETGVDEPTSYAAGGNAGAASSSVPLGRLTWDNGEVHRLTGAVLIGRDVASDDAVLSGRLVALVPSGQNDSMSRVHAELRPRGSEVVVIDKESTNGTFVWDEAGRAWQRLASGQPQTLRSGAVLAFGERTATFEGVAAAVG